ncbi:MAG TPA: ATP-binding protein [Candidatus Sumerlaeota bacterium]|nr:ATP-binding protein [Candidatus Sumerlaeota bacterium]
MIAKKSPLISRSVPRAQSIPVAEVPPDLTPEWQREFMAQRRLEAARIPVRFQSKSFESYKTERHAKRKLVLQAAEAFVSSFNFNAGPPRGLLIEGVVGCGKTHIAIAILREVIQKGYTGLYYNMVDLLSDIRSTYGDATEASESDLLEEVNAPDLLVLDDLGAEKTSEWVNDRLYLIVNRRYESGKPVVVTTNLSLDELIRKVGERTVSRLCEICETFAPFPDEDYRRKHMH